MHVKDISTPKREVIGNDNVVVYRLNEEDQSVPLRVSNKLDRNVYVSALVLQSLPPTIDTTNR